MPEKTPNLGLELDTGSDYYNIGKFNDHFKKIDTYAGVMNAALLALQNGSVTQEEYKKFVANLGASMIKYGNSDFPSVEKALDALFGSVGSLNENVTAVESALTTKVIGNWQIINGFARLSQISSKTMNQNSSMIDITNAMPDASEFYAEVGGAGAPESIYPYGWGRLHIVKYSTNAAVLEFSGSSGTRVWVQTRSGDQLSNWGLRFDNQNYLIPSIDNTFDIGTSALRWKNGYFVTAPIVGSDQRIKKDISPLEITLITKLLMSIIAVQYRLIDGESGRIDYGFISNDVEKALTEAELTSMDFAGFIKSPVLDEDGSETGDYIYALRLEEFIPILWAKCQDYERRLSALEAAK